MSSSTRGESFYNLVRTAVGASADGADVATMRDGRRFFSSITRVDYATALSHQFDRRQIQELFSEMRRLLPDLNRRIFSETRIKHLAQRAANLGATLQARPYDGKRGRALRGFYLSGKGMQGNPLLYVNTSAHPVEVAAAFWHEVGHHLTHRIFDSGDAALNLHFGADYSEHLTSPDELTADMVMTLACYPKRSARQLFETAANNRGSKAERMIVSARRYVFSNTGLDLDPSTPAQENVYRLAGLIHLAKLRAALLNEYGI